MLFFTRLKFTSKIGYLKPLPKVIFAAFENNCPVSLLDLIGWMEKNNRCTCGTYTFVQFFDVDVDCKWRREISKFKVLTTTWTHSSKSFILFTYFNGASTSPFSACSVNNKGCEEESIITISLIFKWRFRCRCYRWCLSSLICISTYRIEGNKTVIAVLNIEISVSARVHAQ